MDMVFPGRLVAVSSALLLLAGCASTDSGAALEDSVASITPAPGASASFESGTVPEYCPTVSLREGTEILTRQTGDAVAYQASISETSRDCRIVDGQLRMRIGVTGLLTPGPRAAPGAVQLPVRVAIVQGDDVLYSQLGQQTVSVDPVGGAQQFIYVDEGIAIPERTERDLVIYAGFDEGPPQG